MLSAVDDFSMTVALDSDWGNIRCLERIFADITRKGENLAVSLSVPKTELMH